LLVASEVRTVIVSSDPRHGQDRPEKTFDDIAVSATIPGLSADLTALFAPVPGLSIPVPNRGNPLGEQQV
jgi:hypothetical protein